jgi:tetratricopeptide (TPR) repeat protein
LECWKNGITGLEYCNFGSTVIIVLTIKFIIDKILIKYFHLGIGNQRRYFLLTRQLNSMIQRCNSLHSCGQALMLVIITAYVTGCASLRQMEMPSLPENLPAHHELTAVPFFPQEEYQCGPAALAMAINWSGLPLRPEDLVDEVYTPSRKGSLQVAVIAAARRHGRLAYEMSDLESIFHEISAGYPVIVLQNLGLSWLPVWHYAVVIGYDTAHKTVILRSGTTARKVMPFGVFEKTWARSKYWGILILQPTQLPAVATERNFVAAVVGLERAQQYRAAVSAYRIALTRWPESLSARMGLGNSYYAMGELKKSESAFKETIRLHPGEGSAYNNLAQVLMEQGHYREALASARKAVSLGGPLKAVYQETLREIESQMAQ